MAALAIAEYNQGETPITVSRRDRRGLEPYRQQSLIEETARGAGQVFVTTHSPPIIALPPARPSGTSITRAGSARWTGEGRHAPHTGPETFLARLGRRRRKA